VFIIIIVHSASSPVCKGFFFPCLVVGENAKAIGEDYWTWCIADFILRLLVADAPCIGHMAIRMKLREKWNIEGSALKDFGATFFCTPCALVQETLEIKEQTLQRQ
jgi:Cys-rich protein (TIGR01571 family)